MNVFARHLQFLRSTCPLVPCGRKRRTVTEQGCLEKLRLRAPKGGFEGQGAASAHRRVLWLLLL